jgi:lipopolysaccharide/colanic/teichoic acid biosynthesis glycosyltransferase
VEYALAVALAILTAPVILILATAVRLTSRGPAFYTQTRLGRGGRTYRIIKLRTMLHNCEAGTGAVWSLPGDSRVTPIGRLLRDTHLDEVPQLWNVVLGHMSLVGPRPERPEISERIERVLPEFRSRLLVRPGVTGLAQMRLPADTDLEGVRKKLAHDLYYVREMSFPLDVRIGFSTAFYFMGAVSHALCTGLVRSYGRAVEVGADKSAQSQPDAYEVGAA